MKNFHFPLALWIALIAFAIEWLPQIAPGAPWLAQVILVLTIAAKCIEVVKNELEAQAQTEADLRRWPLSERRDLAKHMVQPDTLWRMFFGVR